MNSEPKVGVAIIITSDNKVLLMKRRGAHGHGTWSPPGGHLDFGESLEGCAAREAKEEVGLDVVNIRFRAVTNDVFAISQQHYVTIWMDGEAVDGEPSIVDEAEVAEVGWFAWDDLPSPLFLPLENLLAGRSYPPK
jgi:8-oxo-dGTP diphosphatase